MRVPVTSWKSSTALALEKTTTATWTGSLQMNLAICKWRSTQDQACHGGTASPHLKKASSWQEAIACYKNKIVHMRQDITSWWATCKERNSCLCSLSDSRTYICVYTHTHICTHIHTYIYIYVCMYMYIPIYMCTYIHMCTYMNIHVICIYTFPYTCTHTYDLSSKLPTPKKPVSPSYFSVDWL